MRTSHRTDSRRNGAAYRPAMAAPSTDVLIIGAGPVGLSAAVVLAQHGRRMTIVDQLPEGVNESRAAVVHARTLELLEQYGVSERLVARGVRTPLFTVRDRDRVLIPVPFDGLPSRYRYTLMISQAETEALLVGRLKELGGNVIRPARVTGLDPDPGGVTATFEDGRRIRAAYVIGADGKNSTVRELAGIPFSGGTHPLSFTLADVRLRYAPCDEVVLYFSRAGLVVVAPLPGGLHRIVAAVDTAPRAPDATFVQHLLDTRGAQVRPAIVEEVVYGSRHLAHHKVADTFHHGRVLIIGDAAHVHSPAGGQGMNLGIEDAVLLGEALHVVLDGGSSALLEEVATARRDVAKRVVSQVTRLTEVANFGPSRRPLRNLVLSLAGRSYFVRHRLAANLSGLSRRGQSDGGLPG
ncbi:FAD-dependent oxidoreductase [Nonomuraea phyllanthi]|nr:FAD-dependent monooxygenase [Nonomuraea phyllanthi]